MIKHVAIMSLFLGMITVSIAQELPLILDKQGTFEIMKWTDYARYECGFTKAEVTANLQKITELVTIIRNNPVLNEMKGFDGRARIYGSIACSQDRICGVPFRISLEFAAWYRREDGSETRGFIEPPEWSLYTNLIHPHWTIQFSSKPNFFAVPENKETIAPGIDMYDGECFVLYNPDRPEYWLPVSVKEAFEAIYAELKKNSNEIQWDILKKVLDEEWAAFPQSDWNKQATLSGVISRVGTREGFPKIMKVNPAYWDKSKPKSDIQSITFRMITNKKFLSQNTQECMKANSISYHCARFEESLDTDMVVSIQKIIGR